MPPSLLKHLAHKHFFLFIEWMLSNFADRMLSIPCAVSHESSSSRDAGLACASSLYSSVLNVTTDSIFF
jgi:hypothetical protein